MILILVDPNRTTRCVRGAIKAHAWKKLTDSSVRELELDPLEDLLSDKSKDANGAAKADGWGFWGASAKSTKNATGTSETKKEIGKSALTNGRSALSDLPKAPEAAANNDTLPSKSAGTSSTKAKTVAKPNSSVQDRIKALQGDKEGSTLKKAKESTPPQPPAIQTRELREEVTPVVEDRKSSKKSTVIATSKSAGSSKKDKKDSSSSPFADSALVPPKPSSSPLPGGFPLDDNFDFPSHDKMSPSTKKSSSSKDKDKKSSKSTKKEAPTIVDPPMDDLLIPDDSKLPTPPPDKSRKDDSKPSKKERPKVVRDQQSSSWGFWGAAPPPESSSKRSKDGASSPTEKRTDKSDRPGLTRSKSARSKSDKETTDKTSKSSGSDKDAKSSKSRPSTSRGFSMFGMGGNSTPSRSKSTREPERELRSSRRHSVAVDDNGMMSPPPDDRKPKEMSDKAAKVLGRSKSTRDTKPKSRKVPDPYAIDDDNDMVLVDEPGDSGKDMPQFDIPSRDKKKSSKSKRQSTMMSGGLAEGDDAVMVDAPRGSDEPDFVDRPSPIRRTNTTQGLMKKGGLMGGILGAFGAGSRPTPDRRQSRMYESEDGGARRKRGSVYEDDSSKRLRREDRKVGRTRKPSDADGFTDAAPVTDAETPEAKEARRAERRARKDREAAEDEARNARHKDKADAKKTRDREERDRLAKEDEAREARKQEERRARREDREARRAEEDRQAREDEAKSAERRERRREKEREVDERPKPDRRRSSYVDGPEDEEARKQRREDRRMRRSDDVVAGAKDRPRTSRRRSDYPAPVDDYFDRRNGEPAPANGRSSHADSRSVPKTPSSGKDKTASWVDTLNDDPPPPPPLEGTIVDAPVHYGDDGEPQEEGGTARELRNSRRRGDEDGYDRRRRTQKSSDGSSRDYDRRKSYAGGPVNSLGYDEMGAGRTFDGRPARPARRESWLNKIGF